MAQKGKNKILYLLGPIVVILILALLSYLYINCLAPELSPVKRVPLDGKMQVHFIDVGQGDSELIVTPGGKYILIDAGPNSNEVYLHSYLDAQNVKVIDYAIFTHPHNDHIGGARMVLESYKVKNVILPDVTCDTITYERMLEAIERSGALPSLANPGDIITIDGVTLKILAPLGSDYDGLNNYSIVLRIDYGDCSFMMTGDSEKISEYEMLKYWSSSDLDCDVLKLGHHGSSTSTTPEFLAAVSPEIAVASCELGNEFGHPHVEILALMRENGITLYRTDNDGSVVLKSDGAEIKLSN